MQAVTGAFLSQKEAEQAIRKLRAAYQLHKISLLTLGLLARPFSLQPTLAWEPLLAARRKIS